MAEIREWVRAVSAIGLCLSGCGEPIVGSPPAEPSPDGASLDTCIDDGVRREVEKPLADEVQVTEWMANPDGRDSEFEWVEVRFAADVDLQGIELGPSLDALAAVVEGENCVPVDAGSWVVFGASSTAAPRVDAELPFSLGNAGSRSIVVAARGTILDRVDYEGAVEGVATQLDLDGARCPASSDAKYDARNAGTPGDANPACPRALQLGECLDEAGVPRPVDHFGPGQVSISEWMANPSAVDNRRGEWIELRFDAAGDANGLTLSDLVGSTTVQSESCIEVSPGEHLVFARVADSDQNGGLDSKTLPLTLSLNNSNETIALSVDGEELDSVRYETSERGVALQIDDLGQVCSAVHPYGAGDLGTPGAANPRCP